MVKKALATSLLMGIIASSASADEQAKIGVGVGLSDSTTTLRLPIELQSNLRLEPEFGLNYQDGDNVDTTGIVHGDNVDTTNIVLGTGIYLTHQPSPAINLYYGGKVLIDYTSYDYGNGNDDSMTQFVLGGVFGFEYYLDRHFSAGGEAGAYLGFGDTTSLKTQGLALLRYYF